MPEMRELHTRRLTESEREDAETRRFDIEILIVMDSFEAILTGREPQPRHQIVRDYYAAT